MVQSDLPALEVNKDYYVAASFDPTDQASGLTFYVQDLTASGTLQSTSVGHSVDSLYDSTARLYVGTYNNDSSRRWKGLIDEVRFSDEVLPESRLLVSESLFSSTPQPITGVTLDPQPADPLNPAITVETQLTGIVVEGKTYRDLLGATVTAGGDGSTVFNAEGAFDSDELPGGDLWAPLRFGHGKCRDR